MKTVYIFGKSECPVCNDAYEKIKYFKEKKNFGAEIRYFNMTTVEGLAVGSFYEVSDIPTIIILDNNQEVTRWVKTPPISEQFLPYLI